MGQVGIAGNIQEVYGSQVWANWFAQGPSSRNLKTFWNYTDFIGYATNEIWTITAAGTGAAYNAPLTEVDIRPGQFGLFASAVNDVGGIYTGGVFLDEFIFGDGRFILENEIYIPTLSTAVDEYCIYNGFSDSVSGLPTDGALFVYDRAGLGVNWYAVTADNGVRTQTDTGIAVTATAWTKMKIDINYAGTQADFYINDVLVASNVANIPTAAGRRCGIVTLIVKAVGANLRYFGIDWAWLWYDLTTSR